MGYRKARNNVWAKPIGWAFLTFDPSENKIFSWFKGADNKIRLWSSKTYIREDISMFLSFLKDFEAHETKLHSFKMNSLGDSSFEFLTKEQQLEELL